MTGNKKDLKGLCSMKTKKNTTRTTMVISLDEETKKRFKKVARANHMTVSGMLTAWVWTQPVPEDEVTEDEDDE